MKKNKWRSVVGVFVYAVLAFSIVYAIVNIALSPSGTSGNENVKSDYVLMLIQCCLGLVVIGLPTVLERKLSFELPNGMAIAYFIFLYCAIYLGEVRNFYYMIPHWDNILHCFSGAMLGALGFTLVEILNDSDKVAVDLNPYFICLFAVCFALAAGAVWEIYEFAGDSFLGLNMQKFKLEDGTALVGAAALKDTMQDLIIDASGALIVVIGGVLQIKGRERAEKKKGKRLFKEELTPEEVIKK